MASHSSESEDDSNTQNCDYKEDQITEPLLACIRKITMHSDGSENGADDGNPKNCEFNKDQIKKVIACVIKIINICYQSLKNNTKHKERNLLKKRKRAKTAKVYNSRDAIRKICNTIKNIGCSVRDNNRAERLSCLSLAEAAAGTRTQVPAVAGSSGSNIEAIPGTSRGHREVNPGTSLCHTEAILGTSRAHTVPARTGKSTKHAIPVVDTHRNNTDVDETETSKSQGLVLAGNCRKQNGAAAVTSTSNEAMPGKSRCDTDVIAVNSRRQVKPTDAASRILTDTDPGSSRNHTNGVPEAYGSIIDTVSGNSKRHIEELARSPENHSVTAVTEKSYNVTIAAPETSRSLTEVITVTSRSQKKSITGNSRTELTKVIPGNSKGHTETTAETLISDASHTKPILGAPRRLNKEMAEASKNLQIDLGNTSGHPKPVLAETVHSQLKSVFPKTQRTSEVAVPQTPRSRRKTVGENSSRTEPIVAETRKSTIETLTSHTKPVVSSRTHTEAIPETSGSATEAITGISRSHTEATHGISRNHARTTETSIKHTKNVNPISVKRYEALIKRLIKDSGDRAVAEASRSHTGARRTETPRSLTHTDSGTPKKDTEETAGQGCIRPTIPELIRARPMFPERMPVEQPRSVRRKRNASLIKITDISYDSIAEPTQELFPDIPLTHEISIGIPVDVEPKLTGKRKRSSALVKITDMEIRHQAVTSKMTARSESTLNRHIEQGSEISSLNKIRNTNKDNISTDDSKKKLTENCALNGRTEETIPKSTPTKIADADKSKNAEDVKNINILKVIVKPDSTQKFPTKPATSNSTSIKTSENDKENKSVDENKRKTKAKDSTQNAHVEREITNSTLTNDKQPADAKKKTATRSDKSDSMRNERIEETTSNSTLTKISDTKKAEKLMNGKKRKKLEKDFGSLKTTYPTIDLTSGNDFDKPKPPISTSVFKKGSSGPANPAKEPKEPVPKPEQVIDIDGDTCLYDLTQEESTITNSGPISRIDQQVIDLSEDTLANKKSSPKTECNGEIMNVEQATNSTSSIQETCRSEGENVSATNLEPNKETNEHRTDLLEEREVKYAENLLSTNVEKEQASKDSGSSNTVVRSSFFHAPPNQNNQKSNDKSSEQKKLHIKQRLQGNCNSLKKPHDKVTHARKRPYEEPKNDKNKLKPDKIIPEVTITTKTPDSCVTTSPTVIPISQKKKTIRPNSEKHTSNILVNKPELSVSELSRRPPKCPLPHSAIESVMLQAAQRALPNLSITTSTASSEYRTQTMETPSAKLNPVTSKHPSTDSRPPTKRDETKPGGQLTNPVRMNANIHQNVLLPSDPSVSSSLIMQSIAKLDCRPNASSNSSPQYKHTESRPGKPKPINTTDSGQFSKRTKSSEQPTDYFQKKARTVLPATVSETRSDSSNFTSTSAESRPENPKSITKAAKRPTTDSGQFSKTNTRTKSSEQPNDSFEKKARTVPPGTVLETSSSATQQRAQIKRPDSSNFTSTSAESQPEKPKPVTIASKRPSSDSKPFLKTNTGVKPKQQKANPIQNGQINPAAASSQWRPASLTILLSPSQHRDSGNTISLSTNDLEFASRQSTNPKPVPTSQSTSHVAKGSPNLASSPPQVHSAGSQNSNSNRRETNSNNVQTPQIDWHKPVPLQNLTPNRNYGNLNSNVSEAHLNRKSSTKSPIHSWHTPVLSGNEPGLPQTVTASLPSSSRQSSLPHHLRLRPLIQEQSAYQRTPNGRTMAGAVRQLNPPMAPFVVPKNLAAMMNNQKTTIVTQPTWHIPTDATDI